MNEEERRAQLKILDDTICDSVKNFIYYDRKEDQQLPKGEIERMLEDGGTSIKFIIRRFTEELKKGLE